MCLGTKCFPAELPNLFQWDTWTLSFLFQALFSKSGIYDTAICRFSIIKWLWKKINW
jgi:hypothetical protein